MTEPPATHPDTAPPADLTDHGVAAGLLAVARPLAGPGLPETALSVLTEAGWDFDGDELGNSTARWVGDGYVVLARFQPEIADDPPSQLAAAWATDAWPLWQISVVTSAGPAPVWEATFSAHVPAELLAAFLKALADPGPLLRDPLEPGAMLARPLLPGSAAVRTGT